MPRIWEMYLQFLAQQPMITSTRRVFDRALSALPTAQHDRIWASYLRFANAASGHTALRIWRRYIHIHPENTEDFIEVLIGMRAYTEAAKHFVKVLDDVRFLSKHNKGHFELWSELLDVLVEYAAIIDTNVQTGLDVESTIRNGLARFPDQSGVFWVSLAMYWIRRSSFDRARDAFEEALMTVMTVRDFTFIFNAYVEFEESVISTLFDAASMPTAVELSTEKLEIDLEVRMMRFEHLMDRRPFLLNDVLLRQNPNNAPEWEKRVILWGDNVFEIVRTYSNAIAAINPKRAVGAFYKIWAGYARLYERIGDLRSARVIMEKAVKVPFKSASELADMWIEWAELELRQRNYDEAVRIMARAVQGPRQSHVDYFDESLSPQQRIHRSWKLWSFYVDLVESVLTLEEARAVYERIFELRVATPQTVVNYANFLEEQEYHEDSFKVYERGLDLFSYPVAFELWNLYLTKAVSRKIEIERLRDLFEQAVENCPPKFAKTIYLMYGNLEEERGLARHAMRIYERATRAVADEDCADMFDLYITKSASNLGLPSTRPIYERAITSLPDEQAKEMCLRFADLEKRLGEIDRARAIYGHASQFCDPRTNGDFWIRWEQFEIQHGNENTFKEMLRIRRSVQAQYNTDVNFIASRALARSQHVTQNSVDCIALVSADGDVPVEISRGVPFGFVAASKGQDGAGRNEAKNLVESHAIDFKGAKDD